jgi:UrcA family protein
MSQGVFLLSASLLAATPIVASADELVRGRPETATATVVLTGLDLSTPVGIAEAKKRLKMTAERLCRKFRDDRKAADWENYVDCFHDTLAKALEQIGGPTSSVAKN